MYLNILKKRLQEGVDSAKEALESCGKSMDEFKNDVIEHISDYGKQFSESDLWAKLGGVAKKAGANLVYIVLCLFYALDTLPTKQKIIVMGALGYFILPTDAVPDMLVGVGFSDDLAALLAVFQGVRNGIKPENARKAQEKLTEWFGDIDESELPDVGNVSDQQLDDAAGLVSNMKKGGAAKVATKLIGKGIKKTFSK